MRNENMTSKLSTFAHHCIEPQYINIKTFYPKYNMDFTMLKEREIWLKSGIRWYLPLNAHGYEDERLICQFIENPNPIHPLTRKKVDKNLPRDSPFDMLTNEQIDDVIAISHRYYMKVEEFRARHKKTSI